MYLSTFSIIIPIFLGSIFVKTLTKPMLLLYLYVCVTGILEAWSSALHTYGLSNLIFFKIHTIIEFISISALYYMIVNNSIIRMCISVGFILFAWAFLYFEFWIESEDKLNSELRVIESGILISYFILFVLNTYRKSKSPFLEVQPNMILTFGLLFYFLGTFLVYLVYDHLEGDSLMYVWALHSVLNIGLNTIFAIALWKSKKV